MLPPPRSDPLLLVDVGVSIDRRINDVPRVNDHRTDRYAQLPYSSTSYSLRNASTRFHNNLSILTQAVSQLRSLGILVSKDQHRHFHLKLPSICIQLPMPPKTAVQYKSQGARRRSERMFGLSLSSSLASRGNQQQQTHFLLLGK